MAYHLMYRQFLGVDPVPQGSGHASFGPYGAFRTLDGQIMIGVSNDRVYRRFCKAVGHPEWSTDPRFVTNVLRAQTNRAELDALIATEFLTQPTAHWTKVFDDHDVPVSAVQTAGEVLEDPQVAAIGQLEQIDLPGAAEGARIPRLPVSLSENSPRIAGPPPALGQHAYEILKTAGFSDAEIETLQEAKAIAAR